MSYKINYKKPIAVKINWVDANGTSTWKHKCTKLADCITIGYLIKRTKKSLIIGQSIYKKGRMFTGEIVIPIGCVIKVRTIK